MWMTDEGITRRLELNWLRLVGDEGRRGGNRYRAEAEIAEDECQVFPGGASGNEADDANDVDLGVSSISVSGLRVVKLTGHRSMSLTASHRRQVMACRLCMSPKRSSAFKSAIRTSRKRTHPCWNRPAARD